MTKIKLAIADDHAEFRRAIVSKIQLKYDLEVILETESSAELFEQLRVKTPDITLIDIQTPVGNSLEVIDRIRQHYPDLKVIVYSQHDLGTSVIQIYAHGANSFIGKEDDLEELFKAIRLVNRGGIYITSKSGQIIQRHLRTASIKRQCPFKITEIEKKIIKGIFDGLTSMELGHIIHKSHRTVEKYIADIYRKTRVNNKIQLIKVVTEWDMRDW